VCERECVCERENVCWVIGHRPGLTRHGSSGPSSLTFPRTDPSPGIPRLDPCASCFLVFLSSFSPAKSYGECSLLHYYFFLSIFNFSEKLVGKIEAALLENGGFPVSSKTPNSRPPLALDLGKIQEALQNDTTPPPTPPTAPTGLPPTWPVLRRCHILR
jgi:hypothetical protein